MRTPLSVEAREKRNTLLGAFADGLGCMPVACSACGSLITVKVGGMAGLSHGVCSSPLCLATWGLRPAQIEKLLAEWQRRAA